MTDFNVPALLDLINAEERKRLAAAAVRRTYRAGQEIREPEGSRPGMCIVIAGTVAISRMRSDGELALASTVRAGQNFTDIVSVSGKPPEHRAFAIDEAVVDQFAQPVFQRILAEEPGVVRALYQITAFRLLTAIDMWDDARLSDAPVRIARMLLRMLPPGASEGRITYRQEQLAQLLGLSTVSIAQGLKLLANANLVKTKYGAIEVLDTAALSDWARRAG